MSIIQMGLGLFLFFFPITSSLPLPYTVYLLQFLISLILIGAGIILPIAKWRR